MVGPRVAERLGVPLLDREIPEHVARRTGLSEEAVSEVDEKPRGGMARLAQTLARASNITGDAGASDERPDLPERRLRAYVEDFLARSTASGGVAIGRGGMVVLADVPWALHVHLGGPRLSLPGGLPARAGAGGRVLLRLSAVRLDLNLPAGRPKE